jgi:hypothetical protein
MGRQVVHRALDGRRVRLTGELDLSRPATSVAKVATGNRLHEVTSGSLASARAWAEALGVHEFTDEFQVRGGRLRVGHVVQRDRSTDLTERVLAAVWQGERNCAYTHLYHARPADAVALFSDLKPVERAEGVQLALGGRRSAFAEPPELVKEVPALGLLEITALTRRTAQRLPSWPGARTAAGELFRDTVDGQGDYFVLSTGEFLVTVLPEDQKEVRQVPARLARLKVEAA